MSAEILSFETGRPAELAADEPSLVVLAAVSVAAVVGSRHRRPMKSTERT